MKAPACPPNEIQQKSKAPWRASSALPSRALTLPLVLALAVALLAPHSAQANLIVNVTKDSGGVTVVTTGSLNTSSLITTASFIAFTSTPRITDSTSPSDVTLLYATGGPDVHKFNTSGLGTTGPNLLSVSSAHTTLSSSSSIDTKLYIDLNGPLYFGLPVTSGTVTINDSMTFAGSTLLALGFSGPGTETWSWSNSSISDSLTLNVSTVPDHASTAALLGLSCVGIVVIRRKLILA